MNSQTCTQAFLVAALAQPAGHEGAGKRGHTGAVITRG